MATSSCAQRMSVRVAPLSELEIILRAAPFGKHFRRFRPHEGVGRAFQRDRRRHRRLARSPHGLDTGHALSERLVRSEEHTSELQSLMRLSYAVFCLKKKTTKR